MKRITAILIVIILCITPLCALAENMYSSTQNIIYYQVFGDGTAAVVGYKGNITEVEILSEFEGHKVTTVGTNAFAGCNSLCRVTIPDSVSSIERSAFFRCENLVSVSIPNTVTEIESSAFYACTNLVHVTLPNSLTSIGMGAFYNCTNLNSIELPTQISTIEKEAFFDCDALTSVTVPEQVSIIREGAFSNCTNLQEIYVSPKNLAYASIDGILFEKETRTLMCYPAGNNRNHYDIPNGIQAIGEDAFFNCQSLTSISIPDSVRSIGEYAFCGCISMSDIAIPMSTTNIGWYAFSNCLSLSSITIPNSVTQMEGWVFSNCTNLSKVTIMQGVSIIPPCTFYNCSKLTEITIPDSITTIYYSAFSGTSISRIALPKNIERFDFSYCTELREVLLPDTLTEITPWAFRGCTSLTTINIPSKLRVVGESAFEGCSALKEMDFTLCPAILAIDKSAFANCTSLGTILFPQGLPNIGERAFENCTSLTNVSWETVSIPESIVSEGEINYIPTTDRETMIRFFARYAAWQNGYTVIPNLNKDGEQNDPELWREARIDDLKKQIQDKNATINETQRELDNPDVSSGKRKALERRISSVQTEMEEIEAAIANYQNLVIMTDSEAVSQWKENTGLDSSPQFGMSLYENWQTIYTPLYSSEGLPDGFVSLIDFMTSSSGLRYTTAEQRELDRIGKAFSINNDGTVFYRPGSGDPGIGPRAFANCTALTNITIPDSITAIANDAFYSCNRLTFIVDPDSEAEQFCIEHGIRYSYPNADSWLTD